MPQYLTFTTKQEAIAHLQANESLCDDCTDGKYRPKLEMLYHGEYARPEFTPRKYGKEWGIHCERFFYDGTIGAQKSGRL